MTTDQLPSCMGGWCRIREGCQRYEWRPGAALRERLCIPRQDGTMDGYPVQLRRPVGTWEWRSAPVMLQPAGPFDGLAP